MMLGLLVMPVAFSASILLVCGVFYSGWAEADGLTKEDIPKQHVVHSVNGTVSANCDLDSDIKRRLVGLFSASDSVSFSGTLLLEYNNKREFIKVTSADEQGRASLFRLSREISNSPHLVSLISASRRAPCALAPYYVFSVETGHVVAGRAAYRLTIRPRDALRLGYVMDVDDDNHTPLRVVTVAPEGKVLERFEFADIVFSVPVAIASAGFDSTEEPQQPYFGLMDFPPGFSIIAQGVIPDNYLVLSDGLSAVSVFLEPRPQALLDGEGVVLHGATLVYTSGVLDNYLVTVLGEVPITTARLLADAVRISSSH